MNIATVTDLGKRTYTVGEIAEILSISKNSAYNLINKNLFHTIRLGGVIRVSKKSFDEWFMENVDGIEQ